jgi:hypothetical protein
VIGGRAPTKRDLGRCRYSPLRNVGLLTKCALVTGFRLCALESAVRLLCVHSQMRVSALGSELRRAECCNSPEPHSCAFARPGLIPGDLLPALEYLGYMLTHSELVAWLDVRRCAGDSFTAIGRGPGGISPSRTAMAQWRYATLSHGADVGRAALPRAAGVGPWPARRLPSAIDRLSCPVEGCARTL